MSNIIVTILEKLKLTAPFRNEKSAYILMHDKDSGEVSAVPVDAVLAKVNDRVNAIIYPDGFTKTTPVNRVGNTVTIAPNDFAWRIELNPYTNADAFEQILPATSSPELKRIDTLAATKQGTIVYYPGVEDEFVIRPPDIRTDELRITDLTIFGDEVQEHTEPIITEIYTLAEKEKLALLDATTDIDKPVSTAQAAADDTILTAANDYTDSALDNKVDKDGVKVLSDVNFSTAKDAKLASIDATHYLAPLQTTVQLSALPQASITDKARVYVEDELSDYFYDAAAVSGDIAPDDQAGGVGFWRQVAVGGETAVSIKTKYESNADTNAYTDAEQALVATISGKEDSSNKVTTMTGNTTSNVVFLSAKAVYDWAIGLFQVVLVSGTNIKTVGGDSLLGSGDVPPGITITTSSSILTSTAADTNGYKMHGRDTLISNGASVINITIDSNTIGSVTKGGSGTITFVQGSGRTMVQVDGTAVLNGAVGSTATIRSFGTIDYLRISNA